MAENRLYLVHPPTGLYLLLGIKYMSMEWKSADTTFAEEGAAFFEKVNEETALCDSAVRDEFILAYENDPTWICYNHADGTVRWRKSV